MFKSGQFVAEYIEAPDDEELDENQIQPTGVDLRVDRIYNLTSRASLMDTDTTAAQRQEAPTDDAGFYELNTGSYVVQYAETIEIPEDHLGLVFPRSRFHRNGSMLHTSVWDAGYRGKGEGGLNVYNPIRVQPGMRVGQIVFAEAADASGSYDGNYQYENLDE